MKTASAEWDVQSIAHLSGCNLADDSRRQLQVVTGQHCPGGLQQRTPARRLQSLQDNTWLRRNVIFSDIALPRKKAQGPAGFLMPLIDDT